MTAGFTSLSEYILGNNLFTATTKYCVGRCKCAYYNSTLRDSVFSRVVDMHLMPTYTVDTKWIVGDCLYGPSLCDAFTQSFRANHLLDISLVGVRV